MAPFVATLAVVPFRCEWVDVKVVVELEDVEEGDEVVDEAENEEVTEASEDVYVEYEEEDEAPGRGRTCGPTPIPGNRPGGAGV